MEILVNRFYKGEKYTLGHMLVNGKRFCDTLEDTDRMLDFNMNKSVLLSVKVPGQTCIPTGQYKVDAYWWPKYKRVYPLLRDVPAYEGILIHSGADEEDTTGCILVGRIVEGGLADGYTCMAALRKLCTQAWKRHEEVTITIIRNYD